MIRSTLSRVRTAWGAVLGDVRDDKRGDVPGWANVSNTHNAVKTSRPSALR